MLGIVDRYLLSEAAKVFSAIVAILVLVVASMLFLRTLEEVNVGALSAHLVIKFLGFQVVRDMPNLLPPAFFLALLVTLSRFSRDSELIAMSACGIGPQRVFRALLLLAVPVALVTAWISLVLQPWAAAGIHQIRMQQKEQAAQIAGLQPGRFYLEQGGELVLYIGDIDRQQSLGDVFILDRREDAARLVVSRDGQHRIEEGTGDHIVTLSSGHRFDGDPGSAVFMIGEFEEYRIRIRASGAAQGVISKRSTTPSLDLLASPELPDRAELEHRLAAPLAILVLTVIAIPLVALSPRQRSSGRLSLAFLAYFSFFNLQRLAENWLATGVTPVWLTSFWYQLVILGIVYLVLLPESLWLKRMIARVSGGPNGRLGEQPG
ncbi:LPS export ABC transporter permease LptF [Thiocapsa roseopersicina]|uniref:Lipopolysaccharide export system permease protein LptF n=1 Tax=Thiocapsa roseopersicina TaxID=1058 RepID=A0A1H2YZX1_THIRO|nr:LPS export ABC transporter permease LptF [Thiocapsa roseopersicina]SDX10099.1 lipopolysaccharide export system permease protein [Thiocapsa roseopersicina]